MTRKPLLAEMGFPVQGPVKVPTSAEELIAVTRELTDFASGKTPAPISSSAPSLTVPPVRKTLRADVVCLADVAARDVKWLWEPYIPLGMLSMLSGNPGAGKSFVALALCADLTLGQRRQGSSLQRVPPVNVLYMTCENPIAECVRPRLDSLGGDPTRLFTLSEIVSELPNGEQERRPISLSDVAIIEEVISAHSIRMIVVDPLQSFFGSDVDLHRSNETRPVMDRLAKLADKHDCAILLLRHLSKQTGGLAIHRGLGSIDLTGAVRCELLAGALPDDPNSRALIHVKSNIGRYGQTIGYAIDGDAQGNARFTWTGESQITAAELLAAPAAAGEKSALDEAKDWIREQLRDDDRAADEMEKGAKRAGIAWATLQRAKRELGVKSAKSKLLKNAGWRWSLPEGDQQNREHAHTEMLSTFTKSEPVQQVKMINPSLLKTEDDQKDFMSTFQSEDDQLHSRFNPDGSSPPMLSARDEETI